VKEARFVPSDSNWVGFLRDQPTLKTDPVLGYLPAVWRRL
jgi:hypothetical protein